MKPIKKIDKYGKTYYKLGAIDGFHTDGSQYRKYTTYYPETGMSSIEIARELRTRQHEWELQVKRMHDEERKKNVPHNYGKQSFADYADAYLEIRARNKNIKAGTVENYKHYLHGRLRDTFGTKRISDITTADIDRFLASLRKKGMRKGGGYAVPIVDLAPILADKGLTRAAIARQVGISSDTVETVVKASTAFVDEPHFAIVTADKIAHALSTPTDKLFRVEQSMEPLSDKTILEHYNLLRAIFGYAKRKGHISINPMEAVDRPYHKRSRVASLTKAELLAIHKAVLALPVSQFRWKMFVVLLIVTASRRAEIAGLQWQHINFDTGILTIEQQLVGTRIEKATDTTKAEDYRPIKLADEVLNMLKEYRDWYLQMRKSYILPDGTDMWRVGTTSRTQHLQEIFPAELVQPDELISENDFLFVQEGGFPGHPDSINSWMTKFQKENNLAAVYPHKIRHTVASELFAQGLRIEDIAELLGHANSSVTETVYVEVHREAKIRLSEALMNPFDLDYSEGNKSSAKKAL